MVDWQTLGVGLPARDLAYFTATSVPPEQRADTESDLVRAYHAALAGHGVQDYPFDQCWWDYRLAVVQAPLITALGFAFASATERGDELALTMISRGCRAIRELGTLDLIDGLIEGKERIQTGMTREVDRCAAALERAKQGGTVAVVSSGDAGVYGMAGLLIELAAGTGVEVEVIPGITAACSGGAVLGSPLTCDFACISLSDLLTPWDKIEQRLRGAAAGDFCIALYNPSSRRRAASAMTAPFSPSTSVGRPRWRSSHMDARASGSIASSRRASRSRCPVSQSCGVAPVSARNWRSRVRSLRCACAATCRRPSGSARCASTHARTSASEPDAGRGAAFTYCAWVPLRCGGLMRIRETSFAYAWPWSWPSR